MRFREIMIEGMDAHRDGASYLDGELLHGINSPEERAWRAGWEADCADQIREGREPASAMRSYNLLQLA